MSLLFDRKTPQEGLTAHVSWQNFDINHETATSMIASIVYIEITYSSLIWKICQITTVTGSYPVRRQNWDVQISAITFDICDRL